MRRILQQWSVDAFAPAMFPERRDTRALAIDRWLSLWLGHVALWISPFRRWRMRRFAERVLAAGPALEALTDAELATHVTQLSARLARLGLPRGLAVEAFALIREASGRTLGMSHFPVQIIGACALLQGDIAEMATGEGKSLTGALAAATVALARIPVHVVTVNEYLARRDAEELAPLFEFLGLSVGWIESDQSPQERKAMYARDITYCVNKDLVFDYLKDGLGVDGSSAGRQRPITRFLDGRLAPDRQVLRGLHYAIVDEADSIFVDEARTPLIISSQGEKSEGEDDLTVALDIARRLVGQLWILHAAERSVRLTPAGCEAVVRLTQELGGMWRFRRAREQMVEQALAALHLYLPDRQYIVVDSKVHIVDESTGRTMPDRTWEHGLHQLIERKEGLEPTARRETISRLTYQRFFCRYLRLAGMTGTGAEIAPEVRSVYGIDTLRIPTNRPLARRYLGEQVFLRAESRWDAVLLRIREEVGRGRAVLVGARSVVASEHLSAMLAESGIEHTLLNARHAADEAAIVAAAGQPGRVTVATDKAGRGTDIKLHADVRAAGGLHVILTEYHESRRVDRQLFGRAGRQGDPGSCESLVALEDEIFRAHAPALAKAIARSYGQREKLPGWLARVVRVLAQSAAERRNARVRKRTLEGEKHKSRSLAFAGTGE